jgi:adenine-specific DNA methylase
VPCTREKRKEVYRGTIVPQCKKRKATKETTMQVLTEDYLQRIADQVKEATDEAFDHMTQQEEKRHSYMQAQIATL